MYRPWIHCFADGSVQFLEIAVSNVLAAPIWNRIELDTVRELHLAVTEKPE